MEEVSGEGIWRRYRRRRSGWMTVREETIWVEHEADGDPWLVVGICWAWPIFPIPGVETRAQTTY
jgi:hypothetical protein